MELFAADHQHEPLPMLRDLITLYALHYGVDTNDAITMLKQDAQDLRVRYTKKNPNPKAASDEALAVRARIEADHQKFMALMDDMNAATEIKCPACGSIDVSEPDSRDQYECVNCRSFFYGPETP